MSDNKKISKKEKKAIEKINYEKKVMNYNRVVAIELANRSKPKIAPKDVFISLQNINKIYDNLVQAVYDFNIDIKKNEFIVFVGPSGCGKSTTLRMIAGLEEITAGNLFIDGVYANSLAPKDRNIAMVFQSYALYPHMSVYDNLAFSMKIRPTLCKKYDANGDVLMGIDGNKKKELIEEINEVKKHIDKNNKSLYKLESEKSMIDKGKLNDKQKEKVLTLRDKIEYFKDRNVALNNELDSLNKDLEKVVNTIIPQTEYRKLTKNEIDESVQKAANILQIEEYLDRKPKALSGGQRQRVALGRAICKKSKLFLMDEPLSNLDAKLRVSMRSEIIALHKAIGATTIYVTHDQTEAMTMADRIVIMEKGWVRQIGTPKEIYNHPANVFVATFIGSPAMNIYNVLIKDGVITFDNDHILKLDAKTINKLKESIKRKISNIEIFEKHGLEEEYKKELNVKIETFKLRNKNRDIFYVHDSEGNMHNPIDLVKLDKYEEEICKNNFNEKIEKLLSYKEFYLQELEKNEFNVKFGIRPEDIFLKDAPMDKLVKKSNILNLKVNIPELLGNEYFIHCDLNNKDLILKANSSLDIKGNDDISVVFDLNKSHIFDSIDDTLLV